MTPGVHAIFCPNGEEVSTRVSNEMVSLLQRSTLKSSNKSMNDDDSFKWDTFGIDLSRTPYALQNENSSIGEYLGIEYLENKAPLKALIKKFGSPLCPLSGGSVPLSSIGALLPPLLKDLVKDTLIIFTVTMTFINEVTESVLNFLNAAGVIRFLQENRLSPLSSLLGEKGSFEIILLTWKFRKDSLNDLGGVEFALLESLRALSFNEKIGVHCDGNLIGSVYSGYYSHFSNTFLETQNCNLALGNLRSDNLKNATLNDVYSDTQHLSHFLRLRLRFALPLGLGHLSLGAKVKDLPFKEQICLALYKWLLGATSGFSLVVPYLFDHYFKKEKLLTLIETLKEAVSEVPRSILIFTEAEEVFGIADTLSGVGDLSLAMQKRLTPKSKVYFSAPPPFFKMEPLFSVLKLTSALASFLQDLPKARQGGLKAKEISKILDDATLWGEILAWRIYSDVSVEMLLNLPLKKIPLSLIVGLQRAGEIIERVSKLESSSEELSLSTPFNSIKKWQQRVILSNFVLSKNAISNVDGIEEERFSSDDLLYDLPLKSFKLVERHFNFLP